MADRPMDPIQGFAFALEVKGVTEAFFREASGFGSENDVVEYKQAGPKGVTMIHKMPGLLKWQNINLKRGITDNTDLWAWRQKVIQGKIEDARINGSVVAYNEDGAEVIRYNFVRGWPSKWTASGVNAQGNEVIIEEIEIVHEGLEWASG